jgi:predicted RNase H-like nuclease (RuvC/YqgF family)
MNSAPCVEGERRRREADKNRGAKRKSNSERVQAIEKENRELEGQSEELRQERIQLDFENERLRNRAWQQPPSRA